MDDNRESCTERCNIPHLQLCLVNFDTTDTDFWLLDDSK